MKTKLLAFLITLNCITALAQSVVQDFTRTNRLIGTPPADLSATVIPNQTVAKTCKASSCSLYLPTTGNWLILANAYSHQAAWNGAQMYINNVLVDSNTVWGDQQGTGYGFLTGSYSGHMGPVDVTTTTTFGASWGDNTISVVAFLIPN
jgi:hypothetical protein